VAGLKSLCAFECAKWASKTLQYLNEPDRKPASTKLDGNEKPPRRHLTPRQPNEGAELALRPLVQWKKKDKARRLTRRRRGLVENQRLN